MAERNGFQCEVGQLGPFHSEIGMNGDDLVPWGCQVQLLQTLEFAAAMTYQFGKNAIVYRQSKGSEPIEVRNYVEKS